MKSHQTVLNETGFGGVPVLWRSRECKIYKRIKKRETVDQSVFDTCIPIF